MELDRNKIGTIGSRMRAVINDSKEKLQDPKVSFKFQDNEKIESLSSETQKALTSLRAPKPRLCNKITILTSLPGRDVILFQNIDKSDKTQDKLSARIHKPFKDFIEKFEPLVSRLPARGLGGRIHQLIDDYLALKSEELAHLREAMDFLRQCQNEEKEYLIHFGKGSQAEYESKKKFDTSISTLKLVLNLKRLSFAKLQNYKNRGLISQSFLDEVHYYLNPEVYEKWEQRGF